VAMGIALPSSGSAAVDDSDDINITATRRESGGGNGYRRLSDGNIFMAHRGHLVATTSLYGGSGSLQQLSPLVLGWDLVYIVAVQWIVATVVSGGESPPAAPCC